MKKSAAQQQQQQQIQFNRKFIFTHIFDYLNLIGTGNYMLKYKFSIDFSNLQQFVDWNSIGFFLNHNSDAPIIFF